MTGASFTSVSEPCPAKLNLFLHVLSRRADGYHNLFSLAGFTEFGDVITIHPSDTDRTRLTGPFASALDDAGGETIIQRLKAMLRSEGVSLPPTEVVIDKQIPLGGGLGGGSADGAGFMRALAKAGLISGSLDRFIPCLAAIGADIPVCLKREFQIMRQTGDEVMSAGRPEWLPFCVLANPGIHISTSAVFSALSFQPSRTEADIEMLVSAGDWETLISLGNDLTAPVQTHHPEIAEMISQLNVAANDCTGRFYGAAMSGSGASCFALFEKKEDADRLATQLKAAGIWAQTSQLVG